MKKRLDETRNYLELVSNERGKLRGSNVSSVGEREGAYRDVAALQARVAELESQPQAPCVPLAELTEALRNRH